MASTDARPIPLKNTAYRVYFAIWDADGDLVTGATGLDSEVSKDGGTFADCANEATEIATSSGMYYLDLTSTEMNADAVCVIVKTSSSGAKTTPIVLYPEETGDINVDVTGWNGTAVATPDTAGYPKVTHKTGTGTGEVTLTSGRINADLTHIATAAVSTTTAQLGVNVVQISGDSVAADNLEAAADGTGYNLGGGSVVAASVTGNVGGNVTGSVGSVATGGITAASIAADAIGASELAADAATEIATAVWALATRTVTAATNITSTGAAVPITAGGLVSADVTAISTDTVAANNAESFFDGTGYAGTGNAIPTVGVTGSVSGNVLGDVEGSVAAVAAGGITASSIATGAIDADALATDAVTEIAAGIWDRLTSALTTVSSIGKLLVDNINTTISSRASQTSLDTLDDLVDTEVADIQARLPAALVGGRIDANVGAISSDATAADNAEAFFDGTGYAGTGNTIPTVTTATNVTTVNGLASGVITAAAIAADAIGASELAADAAVEIAAAVWDRVLTGATHNIASSAGRRLRTLDATSIWTGTAQAGAANSITLDAGASATSEIYDGNLIVITAGTGAGQARVIAEYNGTTKVATVSQLWVTTPDATSEFQITADHAMDITDHGVAQAGGAATITLAATSSSTDDIYTGQTVLIRTSTGAGQARLITDYVGATRVATVSPAWAVQPTSASVYAVLPVGRTVVDSFTTGAITADALATDAVTEIQSGLATAAALTTVDDFLDTEVAAILAAVDTEVAAIKAQTDLLTFTGSDVRATLDGETVTAATVSDKTGYSLSAGGVAAIWDALLSGITTVSSIGKLIKDYLDAAISTRATPAQVNTEADTALADAGVTTTVTGRIDAAISTRASQSSLDTVDDLLDTEVAAIKAKTDLLAFTGTDVHATLDSETVTLDSTERNALADAFLKRDWSGLTGEAARSVLNALRALRNRIRLEAGSLEVYKEDDTTTAWVAPVTTDPAASAIVEINPP